MENTARIEMLILERGFLICVNNCEGYAVDKISDALKVIEALVKEVENAKP